MQRIGCVDGLRRNVRSSRIDGRAAELGRNGGIVRVWINCVDLLGS